MEYRLIRSSRKTIGLTVDRDGNVIVRAPYKTSIKNIERFIGEHLEWIEKHRAKMLMLSSERSKIEVLSDEKISELAENAAQIFSYKVEKYAGIVGVSYGRITIRRQKTRWGSCSSKGNLNFNVLLMLTPEFVQDYVIVHELCHRLEMNHSVRFWRLVEAVIPEYKKAETWLKKNGSMIMAAGGM